MKRRFKSGIDHPLAPKLQKVQNRSSGEPSGTKKAKSVRFDDTETDGVCVRVSTKGREASKSSRSDAFKTSEYAYFRKVRNGAVRGHSHSLHEANSQVKRSKVNYYFRGNVSPGTPKSTTKDFRRPFSGEREGPSDPCVSISPNAGEYSESDHMRTEELTNKSVQSPSIPFHNITPVGQIPFSSPHYEMPKTSENQCTEKGIFAAKRHRLRQWAVQSLFSDFENQLPKGSDLVSTLLSRLFSKAKENDDPSKEHTDDTSKSPTFQQPENLNKGLQMSRKSCHEDDLPKRYSGRSNGIIPFQWNDSSSRVPHSMYGANSYNQGISSNINQKIMHQTQSGGQHDLSFRLPFERYRSPGYFHFKSLDELNPMNEHFGEEPHKLLLEWDSGKGIDRVNSTDIHGGTATTLATRVPTYYPDQQQILVDGGLLSSSLFANRILELDSLTNYVLKEILPLDFGLNSDDMNNSLAEVGPCSLAFPCISKSLTLTEEGDAEDVLYNNFPLSCTDQYSLRTKTWDRELEDDLFQKCLPVIDFYADNSSFSHSWQSTQNKYNSRSTYRLMEAPDEVSYGFSAGTFTNSLLSSNLRSAFDDTHIHYPLLVDDCNKEDKRDKKLYFYDNQWEYEYAL